MCYESKFILDSFLFRAFPARFLRRLAAIVDFSTRSRVVWLGFVCTEKGYFILQLLDDLHYS